MPYIMLSVIFFNEEENSKSKLDIFIEKVHREPNSDELFPILVYIVLHAEVQLLKYNIE